MSARVAIVTGASGGIGFEIARGLLDREYEVVLAVRDVAKGEATARALGGGEPMQLDLADLASVRAFATAYLARREHLDLLVNNAGIHTARRALTPQGHELTFATNHLGHFLLTRLLLDALTHAAPSRIVNVASEAHRAAGGIDLEDLAREARWSGMRAYAGSKLANVLFTYALARRLEGTGVTANAVHPGSVRSGWARGPESGLLRLGVWLATPFLLSPARGARTPLKLATAPELARVNGRYFVREKEARSSAASYDVDLQERLWRASEALVDPFS